MTKSKITSTAREESINKIVRASLELFARAGYENTSVRMIAAEAGISLGLMYNYFKGKEDVLREIVKRSLEDVKDSFKLDTGDRTIAGKITALMDNCFAIFEEHKTFWKMMYAIRYQPTVLEALNAELGQLSGQVTALTRSIFAEAGIPEPEAEAAVLQAIIDGIGQQYVIFPAEFPKDKIKQSVINKYKNL